MHYSGAEEALRALCEQTGIPVGESQAGKGSLPHGHPQEMGAIGSTGTTAANALAAEADVVIGVGTRWSDFTTASRTAFQGSGVRFVNINVARFDAGKHSGLVGRRRRPRGADRADRPPSTGMPSTTPTASRQADAVAATGTSRSRRPTTRRPRSPTRSPTGLLTQGQVLGAVNELTDPRDVVLCAAGSMPGDLHKLWRVRDRKAYHVEYGYSCMGYEVPASLGIRLADETRDVFAMVGDGGYLMMPTELVTAVQERIKVIVVLVQNHGFHSIGSLSESLGSQRFGTQLPLPRRVVAAASTVTVLPVDLAANARSLGAHVIEVHSAAELEQAIKDAKAAPADGGPVVIHVETDPLVYAPDSASWWDVPVSEVSELDSTQNAFGDYLDHKATQRPFVAPTAPESASMKLALDPYMFRETSRCSSCPALVAELGYEWIELSPRDDFTPFFNHPRVDDAGVAAVKTALSAAGVGVSSVLPLYTWTGPDEDDRQAAVRYWKRAIQIASDLGVDTMNSRVQRQPARGGGLRAAVLAVDGGAAARSSRRRASGWCSSRTPTTGRRTASGGRPDPRHQPPIVSFLYCAPHTFHQGNDCVGIMDKAGDLLTMVARGRLVRPHRRRPGCATSSTRPARRSRSHQHLDIGQGEVDFDEFFAGLERGRLRRHRHHLRLRLGGAGPRVQHLHARDDPLVPRQVVQPHVLTLNQSPATPLTRRKHS